MEQPLMKAAPIDRAETSQFLPRSELARYLMLGQLLSAGAAAAILGLLACLLRSEPISFGALLGAGAVLLLVLLLGVVRYVGFSHQPKQADRSIYEAYADRLCVTDERDGVVLSYYSFRRDEIKRVRHTKSGRVLLARGIAVSVPESVLEEHPAIAAFFAVDQVEVRAQRGRTLLRVLLLAVLGLYLAVLHFGMPFETPALRIAGYAAVLALMLGYAVFAFCQHRVKLFFLYGIVALVFAGLLGYVGLTKELRQLPTAQAEAAPQSATYEQLSAEAAKAGVQLPQFTTSFQSYPFDPDYPDDVGGWMTYTVRSAQAIEEQIAADPHWLTAVPTVLEPAVPYYETGDATLLYNCTTGEWNTVPAESGVYTFLCLDWHRADRDLGIGIWTVEWVV